MSITFFKNWFLSKSRPGKFKAPQCLFTNVRSLTPSVLDTQLWIPLSQDADIESQESLTGTGDEKSKSKTSIESKQRFKIDGRVISDAIIGLSDGLTVPFALTAGLSAMGHTKVVVYGGLAELIAGAISMGLGGYLGAKSEE